MSTVLQTSHDLTGFIDLVMTDRTFRVYRQDVTKLLKLLQKTLKESPIRPWYKQPYDELGIFCHYLVTKMGYDRRQSVKEARPSWLMTLAGSYDRPGYRNDDGKISALLSIASEISGNVIKYGQESIQTVRPPPVSD